MTAREFRAALHEMGWSQGDLAHRLGLHRNTVNDWAQERREIPGYVVEYLRVVGLANEMLK